VVIVRRDIEIFPKDLSVIRKKSQLIARIIGADEYSICIISAELFTNIIDHCTDGTAFMLLEIDRETGKVNSVLRTLADDNELPLTRDQYTVFSREGKVQVDLRQCGLNNEGQRGLHMVGTLCDENGIEFIQRLSRTELGVYFEISLTYPHPNIAA